MRFLVPAALWLLPALLLLAWAYTKDLARRRAWARVSHPRPDLLAAAQSAAPARHLPAVLFGLSCCAWMIALARPVAPIPTPATWPVVLAIDVSRSMEETDIAPTRFEAAKSAAQAFVRGLPRLTRAAVVSFGSSTTTVVPLTHDRERLREGIDSLRVELRTQLGSGLQEAVRLIETEAGAGWNAGAPPPRDPGMYAGPPGPDEPVAVVVLLTDGRASDGVPPLEAAREARAKRVRVYTIGMGTGGDPSKFRSGYWGVLDEPVLRQIADETGGRYYHAGSTAQLHAVYASLARVVGWTRRLGEATGLASLAAAVLLALAIAVSVRTHRIEAP